MTKIAVVTGASSGIGAAVARQLLQNGWEVVGIARRPSTIQEQNYRHFQVDLGDAGNVQDFFENDFPPQVRLADHSRIGLVNNAGMLAKVGAQENLELNDMVRAFTLNTAVPTWLMGFFIKHSGEGRLNIVNVSSGAADNARAGWSTYCSTKAALKMAGMVTAEDISTNAVYEARRGKVCVVSYAPGVVATPMQADVRGSSPKDFPSVQRFIDFHEDGVLKSPDQPAREICKLLGRDDLPPHSDLTFGG